MINPHFHNVKRTVLGLKREVAALKNRTAQGVVQGGLFILRDAQANAPYDTSNLRQSAFAVWKGGQKRLGTFTHRRGITSGKRKDVGVLRRNHTQVINRAKGLTGFGDIVIGFSAPYAVYAHNPPSGHTLHYGEKFFLQRSVQRNRRQALRIVRSYAQRGTGR